jgi:hypothetical protein
MTRLEKDELAKRVADLRVTFDMALSNKRKYPVAEFKALRKGHAVTSRSPLVTR